MARPNPLMQVWIHFVNSLRPRKIKGNLIGEDTNGTKYYEVPSQPHIGQRKPSRWFSPVGGEDSFDKDIPSEWESWLRGRRAEPPTKEELMHNAEIMRIKKLNAAKLDEENKRITPSNLERPLRGAESFPSYGGEFEEVPGMEPKIKKRGDNQ